MTNNQPQRPSPNSIQILIVDDDSRNVKLLETQLRAEGYETISTKNGEEALALINRHPPDLILLDIMMPGMDGFAVASRLKANPTQQNIPIIMVTALDDRNSKLAALDIGAEEFITKPIDRAELRVRVRNLLRLKEYQNFLTHHNELLEQQVAARTTQLREAYRETVYTMMRAAEFKDETTGAHVQRISFYCRDIAEEMGMDKEFCERLFYASPMHDIGKIAIPDAVLLKPAPFTPQEWNIMKGHCAFGAKILELSRSPYVSMGAEIALNHHEHWDGSGYPNGKKEKEIPLSARLMMIADQYDALRSQRPYKQAMSHAQTVNIILNGDGRTLPRHFDPSILNIFSRCADRWNDIYQQIADRT